MKSRAKAISQYLVAYTADKDEKCAAITRSLEAECGLD